MIFLENDCFWSISANDVGMRNFLPNGFGMMKSPANLWRHRNFGVAENVMLMTVEYEDVEYVQQCLLPSTVQKKSIMNVLKLD